MQQTSIIGIFVEDHERIASLLNDFKITKHKNKKKTIEIFNELNKTLRRHFKEEEILYSKYKYETGEILPVLYKLKEEHITLLGYLDKIQQNLKSNTKIETFDLYHLLVRHKNVEERLLYPEFDRVLSEKEKEQVYWDIKVK